MNMIKVFKRLSTSQEATHTRCLRIHLCNQTPEEKVHTLHNKTVSCDCFDSNCQSSATTTN